MQNFTAFSVFLEEDVIAIQRKISRIKSTSPYLTSTAAGQTEPGLTENRYLL